MKTRAILHLILLALVSWSCEQAPSELMEVFVIRAGNHYADQRQMESLQSNSLFFKARFDSTAIYDFESAYWQDSKNKLLGFSDCNSLHHVNSARYAWQWNNNQLEIYAYCYVQGVRNEAFLGTVAIGETATYLLEINPHAYVFTFKDKRLEIERKSDCNVGVYQMLWPYFGGQIPAPHDVRIYLKRF